MIRRPCIEIDALSKTYGDKQAVANLTLTLRPGEVTCLLGPNGAGKSTTLQIILGLKNASTGDVRINGVSTRSPEVYRERRLIGYLPENPILYDTLTGREFLRFVGEVHGVAGSTMAVAESRLNTLDLAADADALIRDYSMGMRKKVALAAALVHDPEILIMDEPTGALDPASARSVKDLLRDAATAGKLVLFTTHIMEIAERLSDRLAIMDHGRLLFDGDLGMLRRSHGHSANETLEDLFLRIVSRDRPAPLLQGV